MIAQLMVLGIGLLWVAYGLSLLLRFPRSGLSLAELQRRATQGGTAQYDYDRELLLPRLEVLRQLIQMTLLVLATIATAAGYRWLIGGALAVALGYGLQVLVVWKPLESLVAVLRRRLEPLLLQVARRWRWLDYAGRPTIQPDMTVGSKQELIELAANAGDIISRDEQNVLRASLQLETMVIRDIMTPRSVVDAVEQSETCGPLVINQLHKTGHSRFPVYDHDLDHVVGMLYLHDLIKQQKAARTIAEAMRPEVYYIREDQDLHRALHGFLRTHHHLCIVVNEYRETVGLLTLEDVIEAILGRKIVDEFDAYDDLRAVASHNPRRNNEPKGKHHL